MRLSTARRRAVGKGAPVLRGGANPCPRAPSCDLLNSTGGSGGLAAILLVSSEQAFANSVWRPVVQAAVRPIPVVFLPPVFDLGFGVREVH